MSSAVARSTKSLQLEIYAYCTDYKLIMLSCSSVTRGVTALNFAQSNKSKYVSFSWEEIRTFWLPLQSHAASWQ